MRGRISRGDRAASEGLPTTGELDASTTQHPVVVSGFLLRHTTATMYTS
jgi:hypothetical protein